MKTISIETEDQQTYDKICWMLEHFQEIRIHTEEEKNATLSQRSPGSSKGKITIHDNFDAPLPDDIMKGFGG